LKKFDVIVVGAGTGGCMTAKTVADKGLDVCLIDRKAEADVGEKVCGDAIGKHHFDELKLECPKGEELKRTIEGVKVFSPDMQTVFRVIAERFHGFIIDRHLFGQRLLNNAIDAGATFLESTQVLQPIIENDYVTGVVAMDQKAGKEFPLHSRVVVDASGFVASLRSSLPPELGIETDIDKEDVIICYREIRELKEQISEPDYCEIYLNQSLFSGGYAWIFPEDGTKVNVGLGVAMADKFPNPKKHLYERVLSQPLFTKSSMVKGGGGHVPTRRPLDCMTGNGIIIVGDAACQVNPIHGGGIGPSMKGGASAGKAIAEALEKDDVSREGLWLYNTMYMQSYGAKQAGLDVFRLLLQELGDEDLNYGMKYELIAEEDIFKTSMGEDVRLNITEKTQRIFRGIKKLSLLKKLRDSANLLRDAKAHYRSYPDSPKDFGAWKKKAHILISQAKR
jgi:digeranylgeranylglycerophospholipid reductase